MILSVHTAIKKYDPEPVEFIQALKGSPITLIFWAVLLLWLWKVLAPSFKKSAPLTNSAHLGFLAIFGVFWGLLEFTLGTIESCSLVLEVGAYSFTAFFSRLQYISYTVLWILLETALAIGFALAISKVIRKKRNAPSLSSQLK